MKVFVGLGNIGKEFENTYHNVGFWCLDELAKKLDVKLDKKLKNGIYCKDVKRGLILAKPTTYMNLSGNAILELMQKFKIKPEEIFVFYDDFDLPAGKYRFRESGSAGTHNGARNITNLIGQNWNRFRIGIKPECDVVLLDYVLSKINLENKEKIGKAINSVVLEAINIVENRK